MTISLVGPVIITQSCSVVTFLLRKSIYTLGGVSSNLWYTVYGSRKLGQLLQNHQVK